MDDIHNIDSLADSFFKDISTRDLRTDYAEREFEMEYVRKSSVLVSIKNNCPLFEEGGKGHGRLESLKHLVHHFCEHNKIKDFKFLAVINDGTRTNVPALAPTTNFSTSNFNTNIPIPLGHTARTKNLDMNLSIKGWDNRVKESPIGDHEKFPWEDKLNKAVFRGTLHPCTHPTSPRELLYRTCEGDSFFDVGFHRVFRSERFKFDGIPVSEGIPFNEQQKYKFIIAVASNFWDERIRLQLLSNSVTIWAKTDCEEWYCPLLKPYEHYIPTDIPFTNLKTNINKYINDDDACRRIVCNANNFAKKYINEKVMHYFFAKILTRLSKL